MTDEIEIDFVFTDFSQHFGKDLVVFALTFFIHAAWAWERGDLKSSVS